MSVPATAHTRQTDIRSPTTHTNPKIRPPAPHAFQPVRGPSEGSLRCTPWPSLARRNWLLRALPMAQRTLRTPQPTPSGKNTARNPAGANPTIAPTSTTYLPPLPIVPHFCGAHRCYTRCPLLLYTLPDPPAPTADTAADNAAHKPAAGPRGHAVGPIFNRLGRRWTTTAPNRPQRESARTHSLTPAQGRPQTAYLASTALNSTAIATTAKTTAIATHTRARHHRPSQK